MSSKIVVLACSMLMSGCSVGMAISGDENPSIGAVREGVSQSEIEYHLGKPIQTATLGNGLHTATYEYEIGNEPSAGRAIGHGVMDVLTLGLWEVVGTPIEGFQGRTEQVTVTYDDNARAVAIRGH